MMECVTWDYDYSQLNGKIKAMFQTTNKMGIFAGLKWGYPQIIQNMTMLV
jgi:hypothetical protein